jgi:uncharacterized protein (DUF2252 family)
VRAIAAYAALIGAPCNPIVPSRYRKASRGRDERTADSSWLNSPWLALIPGGTRALAAFGFASDMKPTISICRPENRQSFLGKQRRLKMARSAHAYVRGNTLQFYEWLESSTGKLVPQGPPVWICGDCHLGNLGPVADAKGRVTIAIRDLDQTVIGNPAHDLIRLGLSLATAIRGSDLPGVTTALMLEQMVEGYQKELEASKHSDDPPKIVQDILKQAVKRRWHHLAEERIEDVKPTIPLGKRFWPLSATETAEIHKIFDAPEVSRLITSLQHRNDGDRVKVLDAAYWMKGCSSLGRLRFAVLVRIGKRKDKELRLVDIKEAVEAAAPHAPGVQMPRDNARRVVEGACKLSPFLGQRMIPWRFRDKAVVLRELLPQDLKLEMDQLTREQAIVSARFLAAVVGRAHASQMDSKTRRNWRRELSRNLSKTLDAPPWLWASVVELASVHELAYLEHCRKYATESGFDKS